MIKIKPITYKHFYYLHTELVYNQNSHFLQILRFFLLLVLIFYYEL